MIDVLRKIGIILLMIPSVIVFTLSCLFIKDSPSHDIADF
jgi:hypothetical protein